MHLIVREIIPGRQQRVRRCPLSKCDRCWHLDYQCQGASRADVGCSYRCGQYHLLMLNNRRRSIEPRPHSRPCLEGACYKYLTSCSCLLTRLHPSVTHTFAHIINLTPPLLGEHSGPVIKRPHRMGPE